MKVSLNDGDIFVNSEILKRISYFEASLRFPSNTTKQLEEYEIGVDCKRELFQDFVRHVAGLNIRVKTEDISDLYSLSSYFAYFELPRELTFECYRYYFLKDYTDSVPWLIEFLSHPDFEEIKNSTPNAHQCLIENAPPGFRIRKLEPLHIPKELDLSSQKSNYISVDPAPILPKYYNISQKYNAGGRQLSKKCYFSLPCFACSDIREALQYYNFQHGNSQSRVSFTRNVSMRLIYGQSTDENTKLMLTFGEFSIDIIHQRYPSIQVHPHSGNSWDFHLNGDKCKGRAITVTGPPQDVLLFLTQETHYKIVSLASLKVHMGNFNRVFQYCSSFGYEPESNSIFFIRSISEMKKVLKILILDESKLVKNLCSRMVFLSYYPQIEDLPI
jgi:hypothetical protein